ncbi:MAG: single-stranded DNA-binding protein [Anaerovoracaceae bacterium]
MNVVVLVGRLVRDPELRYTNSQMPICRTALAVRKDRPSADGKDADFINITIFGKQAETFNRYLTKGQQVAIEGRISTGSYQNQKGDTVYTTDVIVNRFDFIGSKGDSGNRGNYDNSDNYGNNTGYGSPQSGYNQNSGGGYSEPSPASQDMSQSNIPEGFSEIDEDDIPF